jgi:hypothetical protein
MFGREPCNKPNCTWGEQHRRECEARTVARLPTEERIAYHADVKKKRGEAAAQQLIRDVREQWNKPQSLL